MSYEQYLVPLSMPKPTPTFPNEGQLVALHTAVVGSDGGSPKSSPTLTRSGGGFDGKSGEPGAPGEPV